MDFFNYVTNIENWKLKLNYELNSVSLEVEILSLLSLPRIIKSHFL